MKRLLKRWLPDPLINATRHHRLHARRAQVRLRETLARDRLAPSFLIIGAMKAGTTSLFRYLSDHAHVSPPVVKEINYFNFHWSRSPGWYAAHFPLRGNRSDGIVTGEATTSYLVHPEAARRAQSSIPDARIVVLLRDPVRRAISHYYHECRIGLESRPIAEALFASEAYTRFSLSPSEEPEWFAAVYGGARRREKAASLIESCPMHKAYITDSRYADHLPAWLDAFGSERLLALRAEDLFRDPAGQLNKTLRFLELDPVERTNLRAHNIGKYPDSVPEDVIRRLRQEFSEPNQRLAQLLGDDMNWDSS
jgi:hypothetical protein